MYYGWKLNVVKVVLEYYDIDSYLGLLEILSRKDLFKYNVRVNKVYEGVKVYIKKLEMCMINRNKCFNFVVV